jgi:hypothetical protein
MLEHVEVTAHRAALHPETCVCTRDQINSASEEQCPIIPLLLGDQVHKPSVRGIVVARHVWPCNFPCVEHFPRINGVQRTERNARPHPHDELLVQDLTVRPG